MAAFIRSSLLVLGLAAFSPSIASACGGGDKCTCGKSCGCGAKGDCPDKKDGKCDCQGAGECACGESCSCGKPEGEK